MASLPQPAPKLVWRETPDGIVIVDPTAGNVRVLNEVGADIWKLLNDKQSPIESTDDIEAFIVAEYEVEPEKAKIDVKQFLDDLIQQGLLNSQD